MAFKRRKIIGLIIVLLFPSLFYVVLSTGSHSFITTSYFGAKGVDEAGDTLYHQFKQYPLNSPEQYKVVAHYQKDDSVLAYRVLTQLLSLDKDVVKVPELTFFFINHGDDGFAAFEQDAQPLRNKLFVSSQDIQVEEFLSESSYERIKPADVQSPLEWAILVDKEGFIRGSYDAKQYLEIKRLKDDIRILKAAEFIPKKIDHE